MTVTGGAGSTVKNRVDATVLPRLRPRRLGAAIQEQSGVTPVDVWDHIRGLGPMINDFAIWPTRKFTRWMRQINLQ